MLPAFKRLAGLTQNQTHKNIEKKPASFLKLAGFFI